MPYETFMIPDRRYTLTCRRCGAEYQEIHMRVCWECSRIVCKNCSEESKLFVIVTCEDCKDG